MAVVVCHGLKGGAGVTFMAAQVAMGLSEGGADVTVLTIAPRDTLPLHFGLPPTTTLPSLFAPAQDAVLANGINLRSHRAAAEDADFVPALQDLGFLGTGTDQVMVIDAPAGDFSLVRRIVQYANANLCVLNAAPDTLALMPQVLEEAAASDILRTTFAINALDETRRFSRHAAAFIRELVGPKLIGRVRQDESVPEAIAMLQPLARYAPSSVALADARAISAALAPALETPGQPWTAPAAHTLGPSASRAA